MKLSVLTPLLLDGRYLQVGEVVELADDVGLPLIDQGLAAKATVEKAPRGKASAAADAEG